MNCKDLLKKLNEYNRLNRELEQEILQNSVFKVKTEREITARFRTLASNVQRFCGSESFRSVIKNFCYLYSELLSVSAGNLTYKGSVLPPLPFHSDNASAIAEQCVNDIKSSFRVLAQKSGNPETEIKKLCIAFTTLRTVNARIGELTAQAVEKAFAKEDQRIDAIKQKLDALVTSCPALAQPEQIEQQIADLKASVQQELDAFHFQNMVTPSDYTAEIQLPLAKGDVSDEFETGIVYWNPTQDGILHVKIPSGRYEIASDFIIALTMQFLHSYPLMKKQILYCCQNSLSRMDTFLKALKDVCQESVFFKGIEQLEADTFYQAVSECLKSLRNEVKHRASLMESVMAESIYEYNAIKDVEVISPILVFLHDYPTGFSGCRDLGYFFREAAKYGVFCVVLQTEFSENQLGSDFCDPSEYRRTSCELQENGNIQMEQTVYQSIFAERTSIRPLLQALVDHADKGNDSSYLSYEDIGFGKTDLKAAGATKISIPIGKLNNKTFSLDFATASSDEDQKKGIKTPLAYLVVGGPGSGKSALIDALVINGSMAYSPDDLIFYLLDFKDGVTASFYDGENTIPHVRMIAAQSKEEESDIILSGLVTEKERRNELFKAHGTADIAGYNSKSSKKMPRIIVIVDECQNLFASDKLAEKCEKLAREGRSSGIHLVLASQDAKFNMMQHAGKFIDGRFCFSIPDTHDAAQVIDHTYTKALNIDLPKGSGLAYMSLENGANCQKIQIAYHGEDKGGHKADYNRKIREKWKKRGYGIHLIKAGENRPLLLHDCTKETNPLLSENAAFAPIGENYFDHSTFGINLSQDASHSILLLGENEKPSTDILTSLLTRALSLGGEVKLIDESMELSLAHFFGSRPSVTTYTKESYLSALQEVHEEFEKRKQDFRARYTPYFFVINSLYRIDAYRTDKSVESESTSDGNDMDSYYAKINANKSAEEKISGRMTLLSMLKDAAQVCNMHIIVATNSLLANDYDERGAFAGCGYKFLQHGFGSMAYRIMDNAFREQMMNGLNENILFVAHQGSFSKCRYYQYDWNDEKTKKLIVAAATPQNEQ